MTAEDMVLRLAATIVAALGGWLAAAIWLPVLRVRDATLRGVAWTLAALPPLVVAAGLPAGGFLGLLLYVPQDWFLFRNPAVAPALLLVWLAVAAALVVRHSRRDARAAACLEGLAAAAPAPPDLADAVERVSRWMGVAPPRVATADGDGTAFVAGVRSPVLFVPVALWTRLDAAGRRALLLHEIAHIRRRDPLRLRILSVAADVLWPAFPLRWTAARLSDAWEAQADEEAVHGGATRSALARSLVEAWSGPRPAGVLAFGGSAAATATRLTAMRRRPRVVPLLLQVAVLLWAFPWWPVSSAAGVEFRMRTPEDGDRTGRVTVGIAAGDNPLAIFFLRSRLAASR